MAEFPLPLRPLGEFPPSVAPARHDRPPLTDVRDADTLFGAEDAAARLAARIERVQPSTAPAGGDGRLWPPLAPARDHVDGAIAAGVTLVAFGAHGTPASRALGKVLASVRERHPAAVRVAWRHFPDPPAHPRAAIFALAAEAAALRGKFWVLTRELLRMRHDDPADLHAALRRAGLDTERTLAAMRADTGADRIVDDATSALASGVMSAPTLFLDGRRYRGDLSPAAVCAALERAGDARERAPS
jgi:NhaA family Na+:H+ antiporter